MSTLMAKSIRDTLESDGHEVVVADGGQAGIDAFVAAGDRHEPFTAVLSDLGMPYVDGRKVAARGIATTGLRSKGCDAFLGAYRPPVRFLISVSEVEKATANWDHDRPIKAHRGHAGPRLPRRQ